MIPDLVWSSYDDLEGLAAQAQPQPGGWINRTWVVGDAWVIQWLNPLFDPRVNDDIAALTARLRHRGVPVPRLLPTRSGASWVHAPDGGAWRVMERLPGETLLKAPGLPWVTAAARALGALHTALAHEDYTFTSARRFAHDTPLHLHNLAAALRDHPHHRLTPQVAPLAAHILARANALHALPGPLRLVHGDPKLANFLFAPGQSAVTGIVDLDTLGWMTLDAEMGDALRSWCALGGEDAATPTFDRPCFEAAAAAWRDAVQPWITRPEVESLAAGMERIALELAARFAADALNESYFGWDPHAAPTRGDHNLLRARSQAALAAQVADARQDGLDAWLKG